jgi:DNA topoisomerase-1
MLSSEKTAPEASAKEAGLRYVTDATPGIRRYRSGEAFRYTTPAGKPLRDAETLARIRSLVIPPAWVDVWICSAANGHLQATGRDARGRKQSRYHPRWREVRDADKYDRMSAFAKALPRIRRAVKRDLKLKGMPREKVLATIVSVMEQTHIRVGNEEYARTNKSYGLTTLRNRHVDVHGADIVFDFAGKSGVHHTVSLHDQRLAKIIRQTAELPGHDLFQYLDHDGNRHAIDSTAVNDYLREITGEHFTAKDFRTWAGSVLACDMLRSLGSAQSETQAKKNVVEAIKKVAAELGNTPAVCRKCYVHPAVLEAYLGGISKQEAKRELDREITAHRRTLHAEEHALLELIAQRKALTKKR